ncbi:SGNH/GDSL hydrolase family protein [Microbacterium sp. BH-3-3-3]|uniref:SGNH/GDSL hydrolase family protein n=1 Tax=Microbacterium sp. BH-3-3-3 TaxID=1906742 RepID=UPI001642ADFB|nr:SGNH/GDSL hydrolase family protein [Microbacterium sp. BH-3-3-3]
MVNWLAVVTAVVVVGGIGFAVALGSNQAQARPEASTQSSGPFSWEIREQEEAAAAAAAAEAAIVKLPKKADPTSVLFVGDSLTYGAFASTESAAWRPLVTSGLSAQTPIDETWVGGSGLSSVDVTPKVPKDAFDLVIVEIGTNDATNQPEEALESNYTALIGAVRSASPSAGLICLGSWQTAWRVSQTDQEIKSICEANAGTYIKLGDLWLDEANRGPDLRETEFGVGDDFHPNDSGHRAIADRVLAQIRVEG